MIGFEDVFYEDLDDIKAFIAQDSVARALEFEYDLYGEISTLLDMPLRCRKSFYFDDERVRDLIFRGYTIPYFIFGEQIWVLGIFRENLWQYHGKFNQILTQKKGK